MIESDDLTKNTLHQQQDKARERMVAPLQTRRPRKGKEERYKNGDCSVVLEPGYFGGWTFHVFRSDGMEAEVYSTCPTKAEAKRKADRVAYGLNSITF